MTVRIPLAFLAADLAASRAHAIADDTAGQQASSITGWKTQTSVYTRHFDPKPDHNNDRNMQAVATLLADDWLIGAAVLDNAFNQPSQWVHARRSWGLPGSVGWYVKVTGGLLHRYQEPYENKIPFKGLGIAPAIIPALGFRYRSVVAEADLGGLAVVTWTAGVRGRKPG